MTRVFRKPILSASGPIISCAPGPSIARGNGWNSLIGKGLSSSSTCMATSWACQQTDPKAPEVPRRDPRRMEMQTIRSLSAAPSDGGGEPSRKERCARRPGGQVSREVAGGPGKHASALVQAAAARYRSHIRHSVTNILWPQVAARNRAFPHAAGEIMDVHHARRDPA